MAGADIVLASPAPYAASDMSAMSHPESEPVFLVFDRITASVLAAAIKGGWTSGAEDGRSVPLVRLFGEDDNAPGVALLAVGGAMAEAADRARGEPGRWRLIYIRPEMMIAADALGELWDARSAAGMAWGRVRSIDREFKAWPAIRMEAVFAGGGALTEQLRERLGPERPAGFQAEKADGAHYNAALTELLDPALLAGQHATHHPRPALGRFATGDTGAGLAFLARGWHGPERGFTWTAGPAASLLVPATPELDRKCRLVGHMMTDPRRPVRVPIRVDGETVATLLNVNGEGAQVEVEVRLGRRSLGELHRIDLAIQHPVRPCEISESDDGRELGLALAAVELTGDQDPGGRELAFLDDPLAVRILSQRRLRHVLVVAEDAAVGAAAAQRCLDLGCLQALFTSVAGEPDALVLKARRQAVGPDLGRLAEALETAGLRIDTVVLCDPGSIAAWFPACDGAPAYEDASLILNTASGYGCGLAFSAYVSRWAALVKMSAHVTVAETWATS